MRYFYRIIIDAIIGIIHYVSDAQREKRGEPMRYNRYSGGISRESGRDMDFVFLQQMEMEDEKNAEAERLRQQREKYVFGDEDAEMDSIQTQGIISPKNDNDEDDDMMDTI